MNYLGTIRSDVIVLQYQIGDMQKRLDDVARRVDAIKGPR